MKVKIILLLIFCYLFTNVNTVLASQTCSGEVYSFSAITNAKKCNICQKTTKKGCCKDKSKIVKITDKHFKSNHSFDFNSLVAIEPKFIHLFNIHFDFSIQNLIISNVNLFFYSLKTYIFYCLFLI
ncbi:MAG: hypothetical protein EAZ27_04020 [Cytophagales bacterium]|nr:MAG: hypothetical protein EAZ27_04020 [Cytophagales bacterium]